jgi:hypothetical protein
VEEGKLTQTRMKAALLTTRSLGCRLNITLDWLRRRVARSNDRVSFSVNIMGLAGALCLPGGNPGGDRLPHGDSDVMLGLLLENLHQLRLQRLGLTAQLRRLFPPKANIDLSSRKATQ